MIAKGHFSCQALTVDNFWYALKDSNLRPLGSKPSALFAELRACGQDTENRTQHSRFRAEDVTTTLCPDGQGTGS